jgi:hypothetical protein
MTWLSDDGPWIFLVLTVILGGGAAFLGRTRARAVMEAFRGEFSSIWLCSRPPCGFFHYALGEGNLLSLYYYLVTYVLLVGAAWLGFRMMRTTQMVTQYRWLYERTSPLSWKAR